MALISSRTRILVVAPLAIFCASLAGADYKETYRRGREFVDKGNWAQVAKEMRLALAEQPREGERLKLYGMRFESYLPHYYLGLALFKTGDCEGALRAWEVSQNQGAIQKTSEYKTLQRSQEACQLRLAKTKPSPTEPDPASVVQAVLSAEEEIKKAEEAQRALSALETDPRLSAIWLQQASLGKSQGQAKHLLASARAQLEEGRKKGDVAQLSEAGGLATKAAQEFEAVRREATARLNEARAAERKPTTEPTHRATDVRPLPSPVPTGPPGDLLRAAQAYFSGDYREAADSLARTTHPPGPAAFQALLIRAAARHALYRMGGETDEALRRAALDDVERCRRLDPAFVPDPEAFSPRFRGFYRSGQ